VADYARSGQPGRAPNGQAAADFDCCECLAGFAAPAVVQRLDLAGINSVLLLGWGVAAYRSALAQRWPNLLVEAANPLLSADPLPVPKADAYGAVVLSGLIARSAREEEQALEFSAASLPSGGLLVLHDAFLPAGPLPAEVVLGALGRRLTCRPGGSWPVERLRAALESRRFRDIRAEYLAGGTVMVTARKA
jgi:hypothetical protein